jgi:type IV pilus assembly protein PilW
MTRTRQSGVTLLELLVGLAIGLMTIAVALGALLVSRSVSGTVSDASQLQQQGAHALRVIGQQLRQAGSIRLNMAFGAASGAAADPAQRVAFETTFDRANAALRADNNSPLQAGYQNYTEAVNGSATEQSLLADCLGKRSSTAVVQSNFQLDRATGNLRCVGSDGSVETLIGNVADFQVRYVLQAINAAGANMRRVASGSMTAADWQMVVAVDVCLEIFGEESIDTAGATYRNCSWASGQAEAAMGNRMRIVLRNTFQMRSQGAVR